MPGQRLNHFHRATVAVQQKTALGQRAVAEQLLQPTPRLETVDAGREIALGRQPELDGEDFLLPVVAQAGLPAVEAVFAYSTWPSVELLFKLGQSIRRPLVDEPQMQAEARQDAVVALGQVGNGGPVAFASAVDVHFGEANGGAIGDQFVLLIAEPGILQMVVRVEQPHRGWRLVAEAKSEELRLAQSGFDGEFQQRGVVRHTPGQAPREQVVSRLDDGRRADWQFGV